MDKKWFRFFCGGFIFRVSLTSISSAACLQKVSMHLKIHHM